MKAKELNSNFVKHFKIIKMRYLILTLFMFFSASKYETQKYNVIVSDNDFEIRYYPKAPKAKVSSTKNSNGNFYKLFKLLVEIMKTIKFKNDYPCLHEK